MGDFTGIVLYTVLSNNTVYGNKEEVVQILGLHAAVPASLPLSSLNVMSYFQILLSYLVYTVYKGLACSFSPS